MAHPLSQFLYCPRCGSAHFCEHDERSKHCADCHFTFYHNSAASTVSIIENTHGELLVIRRAFEPAKGTLDLPGGFVNPGESMEEGCRREVMEETGLKVISMDYLFSLPNLYLYSDFPIHTTDNFFRCQVSNENSVSAADDASGFLWIPWDELHPEDFGLSSIRKGIEWLLQGREDLFSRHFIRHTHHRKTQYTS